MSKAKARFRSKAKPVPKISAPQIWCVDVYESEAEWGMRLDEHLEFSSENEARAYADEFNRKSAPHDTREHFFHASVSPKNASQK